MNLLIDTPILLWWLSDDAKLPKLASEAISQPHNEVTISAATIWELSIKSTLGRLKVDGDLLGTLSSEGFQLLAIKAQHAWIAGRLPLYHDDPFDRMLIAQANHNDLTLVTVDPAFAAYQVKLLN